MKQLARYSLLLILLASAALYCPAQDDKPALSGPAREAREELQEAARVYREGNFAEAQRHSERALQLDPSNRTAPLFIARTIHAQYRPGDSSPENVAKAREAIEAYKRILSREPGNDEAYKAIAFLYGSIEEDELQREWIKQHAEDRSISDEKRAEAYTVLASKDWNCSYQITELPISKVAYERRGKVIIRYKMPENYADFLAARQCASSGMVNVEQALKLSPDDAMAWSYKTNLLLEMSKLAEMEGLHEQKREYQRQADAAQARTNWLNEESERKRVSQPSEQKP